MDATGFPVAIWRESRGGGALRARAEAIQDLADDASRVFGIGVDSWNPEVIDVALEVLSFNDPEEQA